MKNINQLSEQELIKKTKKLLLRANDLIKSSLADYEKDSDLETALLETKSDLQEIRTRSYDLTNNTLSNLRVDIIEAITTLQQKWEVVVAQNKKVMRQEGLAYQERKARRTKR